MVSSTVLTLVVIPAVCGLVKGRRPPTKSTAAIAAAIEPEPTDLKVATKREEGPMMHDMMSGMGWCMGLASVVGLAVLVLAIAALVKYVFFR